MADGARLDSVVMFVHDLDRSVSFYRDVLALQVTDHSSTAALLAGPSGSQLILRAMGSNAAHPLKKGRHPEGQAIVAHLDTEEGQAQKPDLPAAKSITEMLRGSALTSLSLFLPLQVPGNHSPLFLTQPTGLPWAVHQVQ